LQSDAQKAAFDGDYARAIQLEQQAVSLLGNPESEAVLRGRLAIGQWQLANAEVSAAIATLAPVAAIPASPVQRDAQVLLGRAFVLDGNSVSATVAFSSALDASSVISPWLNVWIGDALMRTNSYTDAIPYFEQSIPLAPNISHEFGRREKLALAHLLTGNLTAALAQYENILSRSQSPAYRARILWESSQVQVAIGQTSAAYARMNEVVAQYPRTAAAASALQALLNSGQPVDELQRGIVGYHNGLHEAAREAFRRAITLYPDRANDVRYWAALNYLRLGSPADALRNLDQTIASNPTGALAVVQAWAEKTKLYANTNDIANARTAVAQLLANAPTGDASADALFETAQQLARNNTLITEAAQVYAKAQSLAPANERAPEALVRSAALDYRLGRITSTLLLAQTAMDTYGDKPQTLLAQLWLGKAQIASGNGPSGTATLQALVQVSPDAYEGTRAAELLSDTTRAPLSFPSPSGRGVGSEGENAAEQSEAETWLTTWTGITDTTKLRNLRDDIRTDPRFVRGGELWRLGFQAEAVDEFAALRDAFTQDGVAQYQLALHYRDIGLYRQSIGAADTLMRISSAKTPSALPVFIAKLLYPTYYADLVLKHSEEFALDPLLVFSLIRQESLFEPFAESIAAANGLMQVIPSTGREINGDLNWPPDYDTADLQKPYVSVRFGTYYLAKQRSFLQGDMYAALAAYNGGAGNSLIWKERSGGDPDLFFMSVNFEETQRYIRTIGANYAIYHRLYAR
jgi:soluble lytic murein transglycosylase